MQILDDLKEILSNDIVDRPSFFQFKHFIIGKEVSIQGKMWQCLRELRSRKSFIENYLMEIEETNDRIELLNIEKDKNTLLLENIFNSESDETIRSLATREHKVKTRQIERQINGLTQHIQILKTKIDDYTEESRFYLSEFKRHEKIEPLKPLDDLDSQKEYWTAKLFQEINLKMLLQQPLDSETIKMILSLHDDSHLKQQVLKMLEGNHKSILNAAKKWTITGDEYID